MERHEKKTAGLPVESAVLGRHVLASVWLGLAVAAFLAPTKLNCGRPVIFQYRLRGDTFAIHATDNFLSFEIGCEAFVEGSAAQCFQHVECALFSSNAQMPFYGAIGKYLEKVIFGFHGTS
jgi:hypothetical protein